ncbi:MAG: glycosyltransferase family 4 protein [Paludibacteraceae bacterium]|nr:glycosyltransferase family 4 protein [Paludibacteraceae bacterium]
MKICFDAKRYYHNSRGLGNYSRDVVRLLREYAPDWQLDLIDKSGLARSFMRVPACDIYHGLSGELPFRIQHQGMRSIVTMHDAIFIRYPQLYSPTYRWLFTQKVQYACRVADCILAISEQTKRDMIEFFHADESKIKVVYQGCSNTFRQPISPEQVTAVRQQYGLPDDYLLDVGAIEPRKNLHNLIRAMAAAHIDLPLVAIGGHSQYADEAAVLAKQLGVRLILRHQVPFADFPAIYTGARVLCYPSIFEGFGIPILEAMCVGTPVLTSTGSCFAETGGDAAMYADPSSPEHIGEQLQHILTDNHLRQEMIAKGFAQAARFDDPTVANNLITLYSSLI